MRPSVNSEPMLDGLAPHVSRRLGKREHVMADQACRANMYRKLSAYEYLPLSWVANRMASVLQLTEPPAVKVFSFVLCQLL